MPDIVRGGVQILHRATFTHSHTHTTHTTHTTHLHLYYHSQNWLHGPHSGVGQQETTRLVAPLVVGTAASSSQLYGTFSAVDGFARPMK